jgi:hypothetical protein
MERIVTYLGSQRHVKKKKKRNNDAVDLKLNKFDTFNNIIIPFFHKYPLKSAKSLDFQSFFFIEAANIIKSKSARQWTAEQLKKK